MRTGGGLVGWADGSSDRLRPGGLRVVGDGAAEPKGGAAGASLRPRMGNGGRDGTIQHSSVLQRAERRGSRMAVGLGWGWPTNGYMRGPSWHVVCAATMHRRRAAPTPPCRADRFGSASVDEGGLGTGSVVLYINCVPRRVESSVLRRHTMSGVGLLRGRCRGKSWQCVGTMGGMRVVFAAAA